MKKNITIYLLFIFITAALLILNTTGNIRAQDEVTQPPEQDSTTAVKDYKEEGSYPNEIAGEFTPGRGFDIVKTKFGSLNISGYGLIRWIDQLPEPQTFNDNLGRERQVQPLRNDIYFHRVFVWLTGFLGTPRFRYNLTLWGLVPTQQTLLFGNLQYMFSRGFRVGTGIGPNLGARSL
ncbi:MAG: hypothetical protein M3R36_17180 [Bacteroidota bacterium]|nr:hypothetical protein [Bacteroidota bacterium]